jgi:large subunit ribosomal protein L25
MSDQEIQLTLKERQQVGKGLNHLKRGGDIPAVIHNHGKESVIVSGTYIDMVKAYSKAGKQQPISLKVGDKDYFAIIKDVDFEPKKNRLRHIVFGTISRTEKVTTEVPVKIEGEIPAEKASLIVINTLDHVEIEALPKNLVDSLAVNGEKLVEVGDKLHVSDIQVPEGVTILTESDQTIATIEMPRSQLAEESAEEESAEGETPAEGESAEAKTETPAE